MFNYHYDSQDICEWWQGFCWSGRSGWLGRCLPQFCHTFEWYGYGHDSWLMITIIIIIEIMAFFIIIMSSIDWLEQGLIQSYNTFCWHDFHDYHFLSSLWWWSSPSSKVSPGCNGHPDMSFEGKGVNCSWVDRFDGGQLFLVPGNWLCSSWIIIDHHKF